MLGLDDVQAAAVRLAPYLRPTPTVHAHRFSELAGCEVYLKEENRQRGGSFKLRGALNRLLTLAPAERAAGVVTASAGNHGQGVAIAAGIVGSRATVVMPDNAPWRRSRRPRATARASCCTARATTMRTSTRTAWPRTAV